MDQEKKIKISDKIDGVQYNINILRNDLKSMNEEIVLIKNLIGEYLLLNHREEPKEKVKGYLWGSY